MKAIYLTTLALLATFAVPAIAETPTFPGAEATGCDPDKFTPIYSEDGTTILYWNNPTCPSVGSGTSYLDSLEAAEADAEA